MTDPIKDTPEARYQRFLALARGNGFAARLANGATLNEGEEHRSDVIVARSERAGDEVMESLFEAFESLVAPSSEARAKR